MQSAPDVLLKIYTSLTKKQQHFAFSSLFLTSGLHLHRFWNTVETPSLSGTSTFSSFTVIFLYHLQLIFANSHFGPINAACLALMKIMAICLVWIFSFIWAFLFELCPWGLDFQQNVTIKSIAWCCAAVYRVRYFEICWGDLSCLCSFLYDYHSLPGMNDKVDANTKPGVLLAFRENFQKCVTISALTVCSRAAVHLWFCTVKHSFRLVKMERQLLLWNISMLKWTGRAFIPNPEVFSLHLRLHMEVLRAGDHITLDAFR